MSGGHPQTPGPNSASGLSRVSIPIHRDRTVPPPFVKLPYGTLRQVPSIGTSSVQAQDRTPDAESRVSGRVGTVPFSRILLTGCQKDSIALCRALGTMPTSSIQTIGTGLLSRSIPTPSRVFQLRCRISPSSSSPQPVQGRSPHHVAIEESKCVKPTDLDN